MVQPVAVTDLYKLVSLAQPVATSDAVFFLQTQMREQEDDYATSIQRFDLHTHATTTWGTLSGKDNALAISDDQRVLTFTSEDPNHQRQVFAQSLTGGSPVQITFDEFGVSAYDWDAKHQIVYYQSAPKKDGKRPAKADPKRPQTISYTKTIYKDNDLGYFAEDERYVIKKQIIGHKTATEIFENPEKFSMGPLSHDGRLLTYSTAGKPEDDNDFSELTYALDTETGAKTVLTGSLMAASLSPVGFNDSDTDLLLWGTTNEIPNISASHLYNYHFADRQLTDLTPDKDVVVGDMIMNADFQQNLSGRVAAFVSDQQYVYTQLSQGTLRLMMATLGDSLSDHQKLVSGPRHVTDFTISADHGEVFFTQSAWTTVAKLSAIALKDGKERDLTDPNHHYETTHQLVEPLRFIFTSDDDVEVPGWYLPPIDAQAKTNYPVILYIHGGPGANYGETFFHELQFHASEGYGVIAINPRGSTSYGQEFQLGVIGHYGEGDYADLMNGLDHVLELDPKIDQDRLYVTGGSYGGFMTNWIESHTNRFKAAVTARSIADWISMYGTSDIGYYFLPWELTGERTMKATDLKPLWNASPLKYVANVSTPTLILHSEQDFRCPIGQGEEWYTSLKLNGVETKMVRFPGENHDLSRIGKPRFRIERMQRIHDWFATHQ
ncbi:alpha/beta hydrolase family protein [Furfurilactobacillus rossiae]|uniref:S9C subfamily peptidase n=1 Tax=Furfurilactobacillus rossiae DSM 15814 TaxID=1114972 RepID=A0A0R1RSP3_9LACO|nr:S9 family peptidase [Furfurilactobacillus rossiae]KRL56299.1 S9C subfamily peptidase [Furfurilactobacillus rossiae DSM 15814]QFR67814.1 alpha/beta fold hydrolase [Furfurilactobacillus rossiae]QLE60790.1 Acylamino-acid-releasing enzyme [Furfurilactobacillus rossiae]